MRFDNATLQLIDDLNNLLLQVRDEDSFEVLS